MRKGSRHRARSRKAHATEAARSTTSPAAIGSASSLVVTPEWGRRPQARLPQTLRTRVPDFARGVRLKPQSFDAQIRTRTVAEGRRNEEVVPTTKKALVPRPTSYEQRGRPSPAPTAHRRELIRRPSSAIAATQGLASTSAKPTLPMSKDHSPQDLDRTIPQCRRRSGGGVDVEARGSSRYGGARGHWSAADARQRLGSGLESIRHSIVLNAATSPGASSWSGRQTGVYGAPRLNPNY